jgi:hypothetical protein
MDEMVLRIKKPELCYVFAENAVRRDREDLAMQAYRRAVDLKAEEHTEVSDVERMVLKSFYAYEEAISYGQRKRKRATGTWQLVTKIGILPTLKKRLTGKTAGEHLEMLKLLKMEDYSFRAVADAIDLDSLLEAQAA